jgi:predicted RNase H-like nuclease
MGREHARLGRVPAVLGVDGCPGGWVGALVDGPTLTWHSGPFAALLALPAQVVAVDIPIGLPAGGKRRRADLEARTALGPQRSSVFLTPPRVVLDAPTQAEATLLSRAAGSVGVSIQTFYLLGKVAEVDALLRADPAAAGRTVEAHPEVSLRRLGGRVLPPKRTLEGGRARLDVLRTWLPDLELPARLPGRAQPDDCLDAVACAWTAARWLRGEAEVLGDEVDALGVPMRIVV